MRSVVLAAPSSSSPAHAAARRDVRVARIVTFLTLAGGFGITVLLYAPVLWLGILSVSADPLAGLPWPLTTRWYASLFTNRQWLGPLLRSVQIATIVALLCMVTATLVGRTLPRLTRGQGLILAGFLVPLAVPGIVIGIDVFIFYRIFLGVRTGLWSLVLVHFIWAFPFALIGMLVVSSRFDVRLLDAAADLGAAPWRRFWDIERPLLMPGILTAGMFGFLLSLTELPRSIFVAGHVQTLPLFTWAETTARGSHIPLIYCLNTMIAVISVTVSVAAVRLLQTSLRS